MVVHRLSHISEEAPRLYLFESKLHTLLCDFNELFLLRAYISDTVHS